MFDLDLIQQAMNGEQSCFEPASQELFGEAMDIAQQYATPEIAWEDLLWAAQLGMEEVLVLQPDTISQETIDDVIRRKVSRVVNGLDRDDFLRVQQAPDAYVNRVFGIGNP